MTGSECIICGTPGARPFLLLDDVPVTCNRLFDTRATALSVSRASIELTFCSQCGHIFNHDFDADRISYGLDYENSLEGSERFREYERALVTALIQRYDLHERLIVEIGCGRGDFLRAICEQGPNSGVGFDPSFAERSSISNMTIRAERYDSRHAPLDPDLICSRHTLEHIAEPRTLLDVVRNDASQNGVPLFFEVPNGLYTLRDGGVWDLIYEHRSFFTPTSLARLFVESGNQPLEVGEAYGGQFLAIHASTTAASSMVNTAAGRELETLVEDFAVTYWKKLEDWNTRLWQMERAGDRPVVWGGGAKAVSFLNALRPAPIEFVVDVNPRKHGMYIAGTGQEIVSPQRLREYRPNVVICINAYYLEEIASQLDGLGLRPQLVAA